MSPTTVQPAGSRHVVVVGGGLAGVACVKRLADQDDVRVTLIDRNNYHQFQPLLYQVATSQLAPSDVSFSLRRLFHDRLGVDVKMAEVSAIDPATRTVLTSDGDSWTGDYLVIAGGSRPNFFHTAGADSHSFPLYSLDDATRLRSRILAVFEDADRDPGLLDRGALNFVVVGGGPTGVEVAGALADMIDTTMAVEYRDLSVDSAQVHLIEHGPALLAPFSDKAHDYVVKVLHRKGVHLHTRVAVTHVNPGHVTLSDGTSIKTRCVIWGGGIKGPAIADGGALPTGHGGRVDVMPDLTVDGAPGVYVAGDMANIPAPGGGTHQQLGSVALQSGDWAARNVLAEMAGRPTRDFRYRDKGIMAMIGRGAAIAEIGPRRHEVHGLIAFSAWIGVHAMLMTGARNRVDAFVQWGWDYFSKTRGPQVLDRASAAGIDWSDDITSAEPGAGRQP